MTTRAKQGGFEDWGSLRDHLIERYAATPHPSTEQEIIDAYELHPDAVTKAALELIDQPNVTSPWGLLKAKATRIAVPPANPTRNSGLTREKAIAHAEQWIRAAGMHSDSTSEIVDELFGDRGQLRQYAQVDLEPNPDPEHKWILGTPQGDTQLVTQMLDYWANHRPTGMQIERDAHARAEKWKADQARIAQLKAQALAELDAKQTAPVDLPF